MRLSFVLATAMCVFVTPAQSQPVDPLTTTSIWEFFPTWAPAQGAKGFGMVPLFDDAAKTQVGAINFLCAGAEDPYLDIYAYKKEVLPTDADPERRWPTITARTILRFENGSIPVSIERGFVFIDVNSQTENTVRRVFDISGSQVTERVLEIPGFVKLKITFRSLKIGSDESDKVFVTFSEMLGLCKSARK